MPWNARQGGPTRVAGGVETTLLWFAVVVLIFPGLLPGHASAGTLYGTLFNPDGEPLTENLPVEIECNGTSYPVRVRNGRYRLRIPDEGRCEISVADQGSNPAPATLFSYREPTKYDFVLTGSPGNYKFRRK